MKHVYDSLSEEVEQLQQLCSAYKEEIVNLKTDNDALIVEKSASEMKMERLVADVEGITSTKEDEISSLQFKHAQELQNIVREHHSAIKRISQEQEQAVREMQQGISRYL